jgi:hypothetical protein
MCKEIFRKIPILMLESVGKFHCGYWNVLEMSTVPVDIHMLENSVSPVVWSCDIHHIYWNFAPVLVTVYSPPVIFVMFVIFSEETIILIFCQCKRTIPCHKHIITMITLELNQA